MMRQIMKFLKRNATVILVALIIIVSLEFIKLPPSSDKETFIRKLQSETFEEPWFRIVVDPTRKAPEQNTEVQHIAFLKVHKSGSTTAQNMFLRFGFHRNLTFILPPFKNVFGYPNIISLRDSLNENNTLPAPKGKTFDLLCNHVIYNRTVFEMYLPKDTVYIGILREPYEQFKSTLNYLRPTYVFKLKSSLPGSEYLKDPMKYEPKTSVVWSFTNNRMAVEFGIPNNIIKSQNLKKVSNYIETLNKEFSLVIIAELFQESIIMMRRILKWSTQDILYLDKNISLKKNESSFMGPYDRQLYRKWAKIDYALYDFFFKRLRQQIREQGTDFDDELLHFKEIQKLVSEFCTQKKITGNAKIEVQASTWSKAFNVTEGDCKLLKKGEIEFIQMIRKRQYGSENI
ncbi:hypothetical protein CHS0354_033846 [Potamilus streckersoni]|uniref:Uncharacterized protein n=1 Tax=Potamilus streckersoni TaxID=2493646 RepID=A0AAE0TI19_9BIVA|nr:hypothetical protein CHS0354_033846 [Potamilus streckersoni]KAK3610807.1 hypothetical protein CHS0354_033846 [Potamilus streckersoni]